MRIKHDGEQIFQFPHKIKRAMLHLVFEHLNYVETVSGNKGTTTKMLATNFLFVDPNVVQAAKTKDSGGKLLSNRFKHKKYMTC